MTSTTTAPTMTASRVPRMVGAYQVAQITNGQVPLFIDDCFAGPSAPRASTYYRTSNGAEAYVSSCVGGSKLQRQPSASQQPAKEAPARGRSGQEVCKNALGNVPAYMTTPSAKPIRIGRAYELGHELGTGSFGSVYQARNVDTDEIVAIKTVLQDPRYKNRELEVMAKLNHPNIVALKDYVYTDAISGTGEACRYLNLVMEFIPETIDRLLLACSNARRNLSVKLVKLYTYQMLRAIGYVHSLGICHRDIKPQNLLVDPETHILKLCDFGSAKKLHKGETSVSYICTRFYRAPELMLGATEYTKAIDIWSAGCVMAELLLGTPLFVGDTSVDQLMKIIGFLGPPSKEQLAAMNNQYTSSYPFAHVAPKRCSKSSFDYLITRHPHVPMEAFDLLGRMLRFSPKERIAPYEALAHPFFDSLRDRASLLSSPAWQLPPLFNLSDHELGQFSSEAKARVLPTWVQRIQC